MSQTKQILTALAVTAVLNVGAAQADTTTFAQFQQNVAGNPFVFTNNYNPSNPNTTNPTFFTNPDANGAARSIPVNFQYQVPNSFSGINSNIAATLTVKSWADGTATVATQGSKKYIDQPLKNVLITITANTPINGKSNLLTVQNGSGGDLVQGTGSIDGRNGGNTASVSADTTVGDNLSFSSDFLSFSNPSDYNYAVSLSSLNPAYGKNGDGFVSSFTAAGTGTFASNPGPSPVPAPSTLTAFSGGVWCVALTLLARARRSRRTASKSA